METTIYWEWEYWTEKAENLACISGYDDFGTRYEASALMATLDEIDKIYDIEIVKRNKKQ
jgi:hypothetical protein